VASVVAGMNLVAIAVLAVVDDSESSAAGAFVYLALIVALPILVIAMAAMAAGRHNAWPERPLLWLAPAFAWVTWGLMISSESSDRWTFAAVLLGAQISASAVCSMTIPRSRA
jgi:hypothetical protein